MFLGSSRPRPKAKILPSGDVIIEPPKDEAAQLIEFPDYDFQADITEDDYKPYLYGTQKVPDAGQIGSELVGLKDPKQVRMEIERQNKIAVQRAKTLAAYAKAGRNIPPPAQFGGIGKGIEAAAKAIPLRGIAGVELPPNFIFVNQGLPNMNEFDRRVAQMSPEQLYQFTIGGNDYIHYLSQPGSVPLRGAERFIEEYNREQPDFIPFQEIPVGGAEGGFPEANVPQEGGGMDTPEPSPVGPPIPAPTPASSSTSVSPTHVLPKKAIDFVYKGAVQWNGKKGSIFTPWANNYVREHGTPASEADLQKMRDAWNNLLPDLKARIRMGETPAEVAETFRPPDQPFDDVLLPDKNKEPTSTIEAPASGTSLSTDTRVPEQIPDPSATFEVKPGKREEMAVDSPPSPETPSGVETETIKPKKDTERLKEKEKEEDTEPPIDDDEPDRRPPIPDADKCEEDKTVKDASEIHKVPKQGYLRPFFLVGGQDILKETEAESVEDIKDWELYDIPVPRNADLTNPLFTHNLRQQRMRYFGINGRWGPQNFYADTPDPPSRSNPRVVSAMQPVMMDSQGNRSPFVNPYTQIYRGNEPNPAYRSSLNPSIDMINMSGTIYPDLSNVIHSSLPDAGPSTRVSDADLRAALSSY
jgi:hypothetical protein